MQDVTLTRGPSRRRVGPEEGLSPARVFLRGVPVRLTDTDAALVLQVAPGRFTTSPVPEPRPRTATKPTPGTQTTPTKEG